MLILLIVVIVNIYQCIIQCKHASKNQVLYLKYIPFLFVKYTSRKLKKNSSHCNLDLFLHKKNKLPTCLKTNQNYSFVGWAG